MASGKRIGSIADLLKKSADAKKKSPKASGILKKAGKSRSPRTEVIQIPASPVKAKMEKANTEQANTPASSPQIDEFVRNRPLVIALPANTANSSSHILTCVSYSVQDDLFTYPPEEVREQLKNEINSEDAGETEKRSELISLNTQVEEQQQGAAEISLPLQPITLAIPENEVVMFGDVPLELDPVKIAQELEKLLLRQRTEAAEMEKMRRLLHLAVQQKADLAEEAIKKKEAETAKTVEKKKEEEKKKDRRARDLAEKTSRLKKAEEEKKKKEEEDLAQEISRREAEEKKEEERKREEEKKKEEERKEKEKKEKEEEKEAEDLAREISRQEKEAEASKKSD